MQKLEKIYILNNNFYNNSFKIMTFKIYTYYSHQE